MVRFSCFPAHINTHKHKKTTQLSMEAMQKTMEDSLEKKALNSYPQITTENKPCLKEDEGIPNGPVDQVPNPSPTGHECRSEDMERKDSIDCDSVGSKNSVKIKKSQSLGSRLNWQGRTSAADPSDEETEHGFSYDESVDPGGLAVHDDIDNQEQAPSDSVQVDSDLTKNISIFSIGDPQKIENEVTDKDDTGLSVGVGLADHTVSGDHTPCGRPTIVKSCSLPRMGSPCRFTSFLTSSRSAEDITALTLRKKGMMHEAGRLTPCLEREDALYDDNEKDIGESPAYETYNCVGLAKDWVVPVSEGANMEKNIQGEISLNHREEVPAKDFKLKRIEDWVNDLQPCDPVEESTEISPCDEGNTSLGEPSPSKVEVKVSPGMEAAKRYISSLNASATAAQLTNLGLVVIPFLSAFSSLKALNLSGNAIVRIAAGALPRGLHILNLSKNNITTIEGLRELTRLRVLDLSYNRILRIGHGLASCTSLKELYLAGNKISEVEGLHRLLKLNVLDLRFNKISTAKSLGQLAANYSCLQALSLEGNPAQKNVGDEQLKRYVESLLPHLTYYNRQSVKVGAMKDTSDRTTRLGIGAHQIDRGLQVDVKNARKGTHGIVAQKVSSSTHGRKSQVVASAKPTRGSRHGHRPPSGMKTAAQGSPLPELSSKNVGVRRDFSILRSRSEGNLGAL